jgi:NAD(P)-dependent dehydrogenase (short-subunit alcohol dehydrogenase family)
VYSLSAERLNGGLLDRTAMVISLGTDIGPALLAGLQAQSARVVLLTDNSEAARARADGIHRLPMNPGSRAAVQSAVDAAVAAVGAPDLAVLCVMPEVSVHLTELAETPRVGLVRERARGDSLHVARIAGHRPSAA